MIKLPRVNLYIFLNPWRELAVVMIVLMEASWITPWFKILTPQVYTAGTLMVWSILTANVLLAYLLIRVIDYFDVKLAFRRIIMVTFIFTSSYIGLKILVYPHQPVSIGELFNQPIREFTNTHYLIPIEYIVVLTILLSSWRGISLAQEYIGPSSILSHFWIGILMYIGFVVLITVLTGEMPDEFFFVFLFSSLVGISSARMAIISHLRGGRETKLKPSWLIGILVMSILIAAIGSVFGNLIGVNFSAIRYVILVAFGTIIVLLWVIVSPIFVFLINIIYRLLSSTNGLSGIGDVFQQLNKLLNSLNQKLASIINGSQVNSFFSSLAPIIKTVILVAILILIIAAILFWLTIKSINHMESKLLEDEDNVSTFNAGQIQTLLSRLWKNRKNSIDSIKRYLDFHQRQRKREAARIRQIYINVLELCETLGNPRPVEMTPLEFEPKIAGIFFELGDEVKLITQAYLRVRYGELPESTNELKQIEYAWMKIRLAGNKLMQQKG